MTIQEYFNQHQIINSPLFGKVKVDMQALWHLENKDAKHKRSIKEFEIRSKCFLLIDKVIEKSYLFQEVKSVKERICIKKYGQKIEEERTVKYYGLVSIVENHKQQLTRIKIVLKHIAGWQHAEFISVVPAWNMKGYNRLYFEDII